MFHGYLFFNSEDAKQILEWIKTLSGEETLWSRPRSLRETWLCRRPRPHGRWTSGGSARQETENKKQKNYHFFLRLADSEEEELAPFNWAQTYQRSLKNMTRGWQSTEVAFAFHTRLSWVRISMFLESVYLVAAMVDWERVKRWHEKRLIIKIGLSVVLSKGNLQMTAHQNLGRRDYF